MKAKGKWIIPLFVPLSLAVAATQGSQISVATPNASFINFSTNRLEELRQKWENVSPADLLKATEAGDAAAQYFHWIREKKEAFEECRSASDRMYAAAYELSIEQRKAAEEKWKAADEPERNRAASAGDKGAQMMVAQLESDRAVARATNAFGWLMKSVEQGFPPAEYDAAIEYLGQSGWLVPEVDHQKGLELLKQAADQNWGFAQYKLGMFYLAGELLPPDLPKALDYFQRQADLGGPRSQYELALLYARGIGEPRSEVDSPVALLRLSAAKGYNLSLHALAERYRTGLGVGLDYVQAIRCYRAAIEADEKTGSNAEDNGGDIFSLVDENLEPRTDTGPGWSGFTRVLSIYRKATERADAGAMKQLGEWYLTGRFVPQDPVAAYYWFNRAANGGAPNAAEKRDSLRAKLRPDQLEQAAKLRETNP